MRARASLRRAAGAAAEERACDLRPAYRPNSGAAEVLNVRVRVLPLVIVGGQVQVYVLQLVVQRLDEVAAVKIISQVTHVDGTRAGTAGRTD